MTPRFTTDTTTDALRADGGGRMSHSLQYWRSYFNTLSDRDLISSWLQHGRPAEDSDNLEAWQAVNEELFNRTLDPFYDRISA